MQQQSFKSLFTVYNYHDIITLGRIKRRILMKVIKRDGRAVDYDSDKIRIAIGKANEEVLEEQRATSRQIENIIKYVESLNRKRILVEDIQDIIERKLMEIKKFDLGKAYILYRHNRALVRKSNTTDESILSLIRNENRGLLKTLHLRICKENISLEKYLEI